MHVNVLIEKSLITHLLRRAMGSGWPGYSPLSTLGIFKKQGIEIKGRLSLWQCLKILLQDGNIHLNFSTDTWHVLQLHRCQKKCLPFLPKNKRLHIIQQYTLKNINLEEGSKQSGDTEIFWNIKQPKTTPKTETLKKKKKRWRCRWENLTGKEKKKR